MLSHQSLFPPLVTATIAGTGYPTVLQGSSTVAVGSAHDKLHLDAASHPLSSSHHSRSWASTAASKTDQSRRIKYEKPSRNRGARSKSRSRSRHASASSVSACLASGGEWSDAATASAPHDSSWRWCVPCPPGTSAVKRNQYSFYAGFAPLDIASPWGVSVPDPSVWVTDACPFLGDENLPSSTLALTTSALRHNVTIARPWTAPTSSKSGVAEDPNASILSSTTRATHSPPTRHPSMSLPHTPAYSITSTASGADLYVTGRAQIYRIPVSSMLSSSSSSSPPVPPLALLPTDGYYPLFARLTDIHLVHSKMLATVYAPSLLQSDAWDLSTGQRTWSVPNVAGHARQARAGGEFPHSVALLPMLGDGTCTIRIWDARTNYTPAASGSMASAFRLARSERVALVKWSPTEPHSLYSSGSHVAKWDIRFAASPVARFEATHSSDVTHMAIVMESAADGAGLVATAARDGEVHVQYMCEAGEVGAAAVTVGVVPGASDVAYLAGNGAESVGFMTVSASGGSARCVKVPQSTCRYLGLGSVDPSTGAQATGTSGPPSLLQSGTRPGVRRWATAESAKVMDASVFDLTESVVTRAMRSRTGSAAADGLRSRGGSGGSSISAVSLPVTEENVRASMPDGAVEAANMAKAKRQRRQNKRSPSRSRTRTRTPSNTLASTTPAAPVATEPKTASPPVASIADLPSSIAHAISTSDANLAHSLVPLLLLALDLDAIKVPPVNVLRNLVLLVLKSNYVAGLEFGVRLVEWWMATRERLREQAKPATGTAGGLIRRLSLTRLSKRGESPEVSAGERQLKAQTTDQRDREAEDWAALIHYLLLPSVYDTDQALDEERRKVVARLKVSEDAAVAAVGGVGGVGDTTVTSLPAHASHAKSAPLSSPGGGIVGHLRRRASFGSGNKSVKRPAVAAALGTASSDSAVHLAEVSLSPAPASSPCATLYTWQSTEDAYKDLVARKQRAQQAISGVLTNPTLVLPMLRSALHIQLALTSRATDAHLVLIDLVRSSPRTISATVLRSYLHALAYASLLPGAQPMWDEYMYAASEMAATYAGFDFSESLVWHIRLRIVVHVLDWCVRVRARLAKCRKVSGDLIDPRTYRIAPDVAADTCVVVAARMARFVHARTGTPLAEEVARIRCEVVQVANEVLEAVGRVGRYAREVGKGEEEQVLMRKAVFEIMTKVKMEVPPYVQQGGADGKVTGAGKRGKVKMADPELYAGLVEKMQDMLFGSA